VAKEHFNEQRDLNEGDKRMHLPTIIPDQRALIE
jgi:hypothetical protein